MTTAGSHFPPDGPLPKRIKDLAARDFQRILLIKPSSLGDVIHALPVLHGLRRRFPGARIDWLVSSSFASLLEGHPDLTDVVRFDRRTFGRMLTSPSAAGAFASFVRKLRHRRYDLVIDLQGLFRSGFLTRATGAKTRLGFRDAREGARAFYTDFILPPQATVHAIDRNYAVAQWLGFADIPIITDLALTGGDREAAARLLDEVDAGGGRLIAVAPGARWDTKVWPADRFVSAIDALQADGQTTCVLLGSPDEIQLCTRIAGSCRARPINLAGRTSLRCLAAVMDRCDLVLCLDSGVMHIAVAQQKSLVCLTGPTSPQRTGPYRRAEDVVRLDLACSPCYFRRLSQCPHEHRCMRELPVAAVLQAVRSRLGLSTPERPVIGA